jgi:hypothetical protein
VSALGVTFPDWLPACGLCGAPAPDAEEMVHDVQLCETCWFAWSQGISIEEARMQVEETAAHWTARLSTEPCTCGVVDVLVGVHARIHLDVTHERPCPRAAPEFEWTDVDEEARRVVFGYDGREYHVARLLSALREILADREVMET